MSENIEIHTQPTRPKRANALNMKNNYRRSERRKVFNPISHDKNLNSEQLFWMTNVVLPDDKVAVVYF